MVFLLLDRVGPRPGDRRFRIGDATDEDLCAVEGVHSRFAVAVSELADELEGGPPAVDVALGIGCEVVVVVALVAVADGSTKGKGQDLEVGLEVDFDVLDGFSVVVMHDRKVGRVGYECRRGCSVRCMTVIRQPKNLGN